MKRCPQCARTFDDEFSFCLMDGSILSAGLDFESPPDIDTERTEPIFPRDPERPERILPLSGQPTEHYRPKMFEPHSDPHEISQTDYKRSGSALQITGLIVGFLVLFFGGFVVVTYLAPEATQATRSNMVNNRATFPTQFPITNPASVDPGLSASNPQYAPDPALGTSLSNDGQPRENTVENNLPTDEKPMPVDEKIYGQEEVDESVVIFARPTAKYPERARRAGITGIVYMDAVFSSNGTVSEVTVTRGLSHGLSDSAAAAVRGAQFTPAKKDGQSVSVRMPVTYSFSIRQQ